MAEHGNSRSLWRPCPLPDVMRGIVGAQCILRWAVYVLLLLLLLLVFVFKYFIIAAAIDKGIAAVVVVSSRRSSGVVYRG